LKHNTTVKPDLPIFGVPEYANGYDLVIHDECAAGITDVAVIEGVLSPHKAGTPGVNLHCAMHSYRFGDFQKPVEIIHLDKEHPITKTLSDWTTGNEELYNIAEGHAPAKAAE
jgi:hypothetical protein